MYIEWSLLILKFVVHQYHIDMPVDIVTTFLSGYYGLLCIIINLYFEFQ